MRVNGQETELQASMDLYSFLTAQGYDALRVAVELNGNVVPRASFKEIILQASDSLEVVCFVGGG